MARSAQPPSDRLPTVPLRINQVLSAETPIWIEKRRVVRLSRELVRNSFQRHEDIGRIWIGVGGSFIYVRKPESTPPFRTQYYDIIYRQKIMVPMRSPNHGHSRMS